MYKRQPSSSWIFPFESKYKTPNTLGIDRIGLIAGASKIYPFKDVFVIDVGSCITYDLLNKENIYLGESQLTSIHTPGHTPGSCCYSFDKSLIAGDTLFVFGCGRCDLHGGSPELMFESLKNLKNNLHKDTIIMPGHNYSISRQSTLEEEINGNPFFSFNNLKDFVSYRMHDHDKTRQEPYAPIKLS